MPDILAVDLSVYWFQNGYIPISGFYTSNNINYPLPKEPYQIITPNSTDYNNYSTFTNNSISSNGEISLATTLDMNYLGGITTEGTLTLTYTGLFTITLYPFINGSNIVINGGATTIATNGTEYTSYGGVVTSGYQYAGYTVTVLSQSFPTTVSSINLYFKFDLPASATPSAYTQ